MFATIEIGKAFELLQEKYKRDFAAYDNVEVHFEKTKKKKDMSSWGADTNDNDYEYLGIITYDRILGDLTIKCEMEKEDFSLGVDLCAELQERYENDELYVYDVRFDASKAIALVEFKLKEKTYTYSY